MLRRLLALALLSGGIAAIISCREQEAPFDATGSFEADEIIVPAEAAGVVKALDLQEGQELEAGQYLGYIDTLQLSLQKKQLRAQIGAIGSRMPDIGAQTAFYDQQLEVLKVRQASLLKEQSRLAQLRQADAATGKQLDDIQAALDELREQMKVVQDQRQAQVSALSTQRSALQKDPLPLQVQIELLEEQIRKCRIVNPVKGTVLSQYTKAHEMASPGKPLYKVADLSGLLLRAYVTGLQLPQLRLNQRLTVLTDDGKGGYRESPGVVTWISDKAEFTPKTILTKQERANLVYAVKVKVANPEGIYKPGMYGAVRF